jgi:hypothetical protein
LVQGQVVEETFQGGVANDGAPMTPRAGALTGLAEAELLPLGVNPANDVAFELLPGGQPLV